MMKILLIVLLSLTVLIGIFTVVVSWNQKSFIAMARDEARRAFNATKASNTPITEDQLLDLPAPVQRYLAYAGVVGKTPVHSVRLQMQGDFKTAPEQSFFKMQAEEYYTTTPPFFTWIGTITMAPFLNVTARDKYHSGRGNMWIKLLSTFTIENATGDFMDDATLMRYLNEMMWFPTAYLGENITWEAIDDSSARLTITDFGKSATAIVFFNDSGEMINFEAQRFCSYTKQMETWQTPIRAYKEFDGLKIPTEGEGLWKLESGDYVYIRLKVVDIDFNVNETY
jgi:hypothetical protein